MTPPDVPPAGPRPTARPVTRPAELPGPVLAAAAVAWLAAYALPILVTDLPAPARHACTAVTAGVWVLFGVDYLRRLAQAHDRVRFVVTHPLDLALLVLPALGPLRLLRVLTVLRILNRNSGSSLRGRVGLYVVSATTVVGFCAALAVLEAERTDPAAVITTFPDACWWVATTITTVGYGDLYPVTGTGRLVAVGLMLAGIALLGVVTASLASWLIDRVSDEQEESAAATRADVQALAREVRQLRAELRAERGGPDPRPGG
ncbi:potassium channel family protein [Kineococcus sp. LSe6-4]|uniref:Potassium channel family protein n=1 Tax=Kineococcus halophytocola TaxID=3234027 RepID=A0ABV4H2G4_9ACTN